MASSNSSVGTPDPYTTTGAGADLEVKMKADLPYDVKPMFRGSVFTPASYTVRYSSRNEFRNFLLLHYWCLN